MQVAAEHDTNPTRREGGAACGRLLGTPLRRWRIRLMYEIPNNGSAAANYACPRNSGCTISGIEFAPAQPLPGDLTAFCY